MDRKGSFLPIQPRDLVRGGTYRKFHLVPSPLNWDSTRNSDWLAPTGKALRGRGGRASSLYLSHRPKDPRPSKRSRGVVDAGMGPMHCWNPGRDYREPLTSRPRLQENRNLEIWARVLKPPSIALAFCHRNVLEQSRLKNIGPAICHCESGASALRTGTPRL